MAPSADEPYAAQEAVVAVGESDGSTAPASEGATGGSGTESEDGSDEGGPDPDATDGDGQASMEEYL